mgnify:CR=1 FL=1
MEKSAKLYQTFDKRKTYLEIPLLSSRMMEKKEKSCFSFRLVVFLPIEKEKGYGIQIRCHRHRCGPRRV